MASRDLMKMLDTAIETPHDGVVNFGALRELLKAMIGQLGQQQLPVLEPGQSPTPLLGKDQDTTAQPGQEKEEDGVPGTGQQPQEPEEQLPGKDTLEETRSNSEVTSVAKDLTLKATEEKQRDIAKEGSGDQSAPAEPPELDVDTQHAESSARGPNAAGTQPRTKTSQGTPGTESGSLGMQAGSQGAPVTPEKSGSVPSDQTKASDASTTTTGTQPKSPSTQVTTTGVEPGSPSTQATAPGMQTRSPGTKTTTLHTQPGATGTQSTIPVMQPGSHSTRTIVLGMQPGSPGTQVITLEMEPESPGTHATTPGMQSGSPGTHATTPGMQSGSPGTHATTPGTQPAPQGTWLDAASPRHGDKALPSTVLAQAGHPAVQTILPTAQGFEILPDTDPRATSPWEEPAMPWESSGSSGTAVEVEEAFRQIGQLGHICAALKERVAQLETTKSDRAELDNLRWLFPEGGQESITGILANLRGQVSSVQGLARNLQATEEKIRQLENALGKLRIDGAGRKADDSGQITLPLGSTQQEMKQELKGEQQETTKAMLVQVVTKTSEQLQAEQLDEPRVMAQNGGQEQAGCPICNSDTRVQVGKLLQRYEKLQELVESFMSQQMVGKMVRQLLGRSKQDELLKHIQATITQVQGDYKQLSSVLRNLLDDHHQEQKTIEALFQALERLKKQKADKEELLLLGIDEKADKAALADKVSRSQFEASVERLNEMVEEVASRVTGQEQDWHQFQQQLQRELDSKLDRRELGPFRQQLEERWKSLREQLQEKALQPEGHDAAGIRKQLLAGFHCLSCDRPLNMLPPGPEQTGECRYPAVPRSCGGPHTLTPPRFQPHLPSTPQRLPPIVRRPNKVGMTEKDVMLLCQDGIGAGQQDGQLPVLGDQAGFPRDNPELSLRQRDSPDTESTLSCSQGKGTAQTPSPR